MSKPRWAELKADGRVVFDFPKRKMAIYPNDCGGVIVLTVNHDQTSYFDVYPNDFAEMAAQLARSMGEAKANYDRIEAEFETHVAIQKARD